MIDAAKFVAASRWTSELDASSATHCAAEIISTWQQRMLNCEPDRYGKNVPIGPGFNETIDLVDYYEKVGYEMKLVGSTADHEFYVALFKAATFNQHHKAIKMQRLIFIADTEVAGRLEKGLGDAAAELSRNWNIIVELAKLD